MRENKKFSERSSQDRHNSIINYFLFFEGQITEDIYFKELKNRSQQIGLNPLIQLRSMMRGSQERGMSNPKQVVELILMYYMDFKRNDKSYGFIINTIIDYLVETNTYSVQDSHKLGLELNCYCKEQYKLSENLFVQYPDDQIEFCNVILEFVFNKIGKERKQDDVDLIIDALNIKYDEYRDKICIIIDRDPCSFKEDQYDEVVELCESNNFKLYISNPRFEFWLLLHFSFNEICELDREKLLNRVKHKKCGKCYDEEKLNDLCKRYTSKGYNKTNYRVDYMLSNVENAIENEKEFCENIEQLKTKLGCNIGLLINELINNSE